MIIPDVNILVHAYDAGFTHHEAAKAWWEDALTSGRPVGLAWAASLGFIRITTNRNIFEHPLAAREAVRIVRSWLEQPRVQLLVPGEQHGEIVFRLLEELGTAGNLTTDAHLAALALEYQAEIASTDNDFARFRGLRWFNPVAPRAKKR